MTRQLAGIQAYSRRRAAEGGIPYRLFVPFDSDMSGAAEVDTGNRMSLSGGDLLIIDGGSSTDPVAWWPAQTKTPGLCVGFTVVQTSPSTALSANWGWDTDQVSDLRDHRFFTSGVSAILSARDGASGGEYNVSIGTFTPLKMHYLALLVLETQVGWCAKGGIYSDWVMLHKATRASGVPSTIYPAVNASNRNSVVKELFTASAGWGDSIVASLSDGDPITGSVRTILNQWFASKFVTIEQIEDDFVMAGSYVGVRSDGIHYWFHCDLGGGDEWRLFYKELDASPMHQITLSQIWAGGLKTEDFSVTESVWEYAINHPDNPNGFVGNAHGNDTQVSLTFYLDDIEITPTGTLQTGNELRIIRISTLDNGSAVTLGTITTTYTMTPTTGLTIELVFDWLAEPVPPMHGRLGMWPIENRFDRGFTLGYDIAWNLDTAVAAEDLASEYISTTAMVAWESAGTWALAQFRASPITSFFQDRGPTNVNKFYTDETPPVTAGNIQTCVPINYRMARISDLSKYTALALAPTS